MKSILKDTLITRVHNSAAAAQTAIDDSTILNMAGYDAIAFVVALGDVDSGCVLTLSAQQNTINSASGMAALTGTTTFTADATTADNKTLILDVIRPAEQYVRPVLTRTTANAVLDGIFAIQYRAATCPITQGSTVAASAVIVDAVES